MDRRSDTISSTGRATMLLMTLMMFSIVLKASSSDLQVNITSNVTLTDSLVCENALISLTCDAVNATKPEYKWFPLEETNRTIVVTVTDVSTEYNCTVTDVNHNTGYSAINVLSNGSAPVLFKHFPDYADLYSGYAANFTVEIVRSSPPLVHSSWSRFHAPLNDSGRAFIFNFTSGGSQYSSLVIHDLSISYDSGNYTYCASNKCGESCVSGNLNVLPGIICYDDNMPLPITSISDNQTAVEGGNVTYMCSFGANYNDHTSGIYFINWMIQIKDGDVIYVDDKTFSDMYKVDAPSQDCPPGNSSCCNFISKLHIHTTVVLDQAVISCHVNAYSLNNEKNSLLSVIPKPVITAPPSRHLSIVKGNTAELRCVVNASSLKSLTNFKWLKNGDNLMSDEKYNITQHQIPDSEDKNVLESILRIFNFTKQDTGKYSCFVYYDPDVLEQLHIITDGENLSDEANTYLIIAGNSRTVLSTGEIVAIVVGGMVALMLVVVVAAAALLVYFCCCKKQEYSLVGQGSYRDYDATGNTRHPDTTSNSVTHGSSNMHSENNDGTRIPVDVMPSENVDELEERDGISSDPGGNRESVAFSFPADSNADGASVPPEIVDVIITKEPQEISIGEKAKQEPPVQIKKLTSVHDILSQGAVHKWKQLGLQLGLKESKLDTISADYKDDPEENMTKVFKLWKTQSLQPTWKNLIAAIEQTRLNLQLSQTLRNLHQKEIEKEVQSKDFANEVLTPMANHWFEFGLKLDIDENQLSSIMPVNTKKFFNTMLSEWWHQTKDAYRTWNKVVSALDAVKLSGLAKRIYDSKIKQAESFKDDDR